MDIFFAEDCWENPLQKVVLDVQIICKILGTTWVQVEQCDKQFKIIFNEIAWSLKLIKLTNKKKERDKHVLR